MTRLEFLAALREALSGLPQEDIEERLNFYAEMIDDRIEEGVDEAEAIEALGSVGTIAEQTLREIPLTKLVKKKVKRERKMKAWEIVLLALGSPLWITLLVVAFVVLVVTTYALLWVLVAVVWSLFAALAVMAVGLVALSIVWMVTENVFFGLAILGAGLVCAGFSVLLFLGCIAATKGGAILSKKIFIGIKKMFVRKEKKHA